jgi:hypothetical protein
MTVRNVAAFLILWGGLAAVLGVVIAAFIRVGAREMPPAPGGGDTPPGVASPAPGPDEEAQL